MPCKGSLVLSRRRQHGAGPAQGDLVHQPLPPESPPPTSTTTAHSLTPTLRTALNLASSPSGDLPGCRRLVRRTPKRCPRVTCALDTRVEVVTPASLPPAPPQPLTPETPAPGSPCPLSLSQGCPDCSGGQWGWSSSLRGCVGPTAHVREPR